MKLADLVSIFQWHNTVLFKLTGFGEAEYDTVDFADAFCEIEALQQENVEWQENYVELDTGHSKLYKAYCEIKQENKQLQAQAARMREALEEATETIENIYEKDIPQTEKYRSILNFDTPADYHNPADVAEIEQRGEWIDQQATKILRQDAALAKARETLISVSFRSGLGSDEETIQEALAAIDKIGGREDV